MQELSLQAMHKICLAHFERDQAAGGNMYVKFARCYLELAGKEYSQLKAKEPLHAPATDTGQFQASCITLLSQCNWAEGSVCLQT